MGVFSRAQRILVSVVGQITRAISKDCSVRSSGWADLINPSVLIKVHRTRDRARAVFAVACVFEHLQDVDGFFFSKAP